MTILELLVRSDSAKALGWTLVHSLWEGAAVALALGIVLAIARSSRVRYAASCLAMLGLLAGFSVTLYRLMPREIRHVAAVRALPLPVGNSVDDGALVNHRTPGDASELLPWLAPIWLAGVLLFQLRCLAAWIAAGRLRRVGVCGVPAAWVEKVDDLRARLRVTRPVTILESCFAEVPVVIGHLRPAILLPVGLLAGLPMGQIEAILLHELAHIRRADYLVNLMQTLVEGLLFYHPAAWWISNAIRTERENCCDDLVVLTNGDAHGYATALTALAENRWTLRQAALAATGGNLVNRIRRLLAHPENPRMTIAPVLSVGILVVTGAVVLTAWQVPAPAVPRARAQTAPATRESPYDKWLKEEVVYIITDQERADFKKLQSDADRAHFIEEFWKRRDPTPGTPENEFKDEHYRRIAYANDRFRDAKLPGWKTDRGRIYILYGPPNEIDSHPSGGTYVRPSEQGGAQTVTYPFEQWMYRFIEGIGNNVVLEFVDKGKTGEYRLTMDPREKEVARREDQARAVEELEAKRALDRRASAIVTKEMKKQLELLERQFQSRDKEFEALREHGDLSGSEAQVEQARIQVERLRALTEKLGSDSAQQQLLEAQEKLLEKQAEMEKLEMNLRALESDLEPAHPEHQENSVFVSGSASQAVVVILPNRHMLVTIPFEFPAGQYSITASAVASDGQTVWKETSTNGSHTMGGIALAPGSYTLNALVKDAAGPTQKTYVVNFSVK
jgi:GWxTD domain-containing protein